MAEYIEREALKQSIKIMPRVTHPELVLYSSVQKIISNVPTADVVEVVRCERCKYAYFRYNADKYPFGIYACKKQPTGRTHKKVRGDFFCSYGELKEVQGK